MRMQADSSKKSPSPSGVLSNGSNSLSPGRKGGFQKITNGSSHSKADSNGSAASYTNGHSVSSLRRPQTSFFGHDREEVTRLLIQGLADLGYHGAAGTLSRESGYELEGPTVAAFRNAVLQGDWAEAEALLFGPEYPDDGGGVGIQDADIDYNKDQGRTPRHSWAAPSYGGGLLLAEGANKNEMLFWMRQQKYLELLETRDLGAALMVLRQELTPLHRDVNRLHSLSSLMMCESAEDLKSQAQWDGAAGFSRNRLLSELSKSISPSIMIPENRLAILLDQVKNVWISECMYHTSTETPSLFTDHVCDRVDFPLKTVLELRSHSDEVWFIQFSNDGSMLATASKDNTVIIYETVTYRVLHTLSEHESGVCYVAWSPDDTKLITCAQARDNSARLWDTRTGTCLYTISEFTYAVTTAAWAPDGKYFITGSQDSERALCLWNLDGEKVHAWKEENLRVHDLCISPDGHRLVVLLENRVLVYDFITRERIRDWPIEGAKLTSVNISPDSEQILVSMNPNQIHLMDMDSGEVLRCYEGQQQSQFIIRSAFGGVNGNYVISGSENSQIFIWRRASGKVLEVFEAHKPGCVNAVSWHPRDPRIFASAGDDHKVRIWGKPSTPTQQAGYGSNGHNR